MGELKAAHLREEMELSLAISQYERREYFWIGQQYVWEYLDWMNQRTGCGQEECGGGADQAMIFCLIFYREWQREQSENEKKFPRIAETLDGKGEIFLTKEEHEAVVHYLDIQQKWRRQNGGSITVSDTSMHKDTSGS